MEENDLELVDRIRAGDSDAFRQIVENHSRKLFQAVYRLVGNQEDADDVVQDTFLKAYRSLHRFDGRSQIGTWLYRIAVNCAMDTMRRKTRRRRHEVDEEKVEIASLATDLPLPDRMAQSDELGRAVGKVLARLSPTERTAFVLRHFEGHSSVEIGHLLGIRSGATRNAVFRAVKKLRTALEPLLEARQGVES